MARFRRAVARGGERRRAAYADVAFNHLNRRRLPPSISGFVAAADVAILSPAFTHGKTML